MERVRRGSLADYVISRYKHNRPISEQEARIIMKQILEAIKYIHSNNIIHRDLKPDNILIMSFENIEGAIRILDFGLSVQLESEAEEIIVERCGTQYYMAPEQLEGKIYTKVRE